MDQANNSLLDLEELDDKELDRIRETHAVLARKERVDRAGKGGTLSRQSVPLASCSRSIASNSALKLPFRTIGTKTVAEALGASRSTGMSKLALRER